jgi:glutamate-1-semialdehyde 2,1-aminomutase
MSATDANRFVLRFARHLTGRPRIAVMDWCYHGTVDETLAVLDGDRVVARPGGLGPQVPVAETTAVVPFNDAEALDRRLAEGDVACLLMEPALTNIGIVLPEEGYLSAVRDITRRHGVLLVNDETHTLCAARAAPRRPGTSIRTCWSSASRSAAASRWRRTACRPTSPSSSAARCAGTRSTSPASAER